MAVGSIASQNTSNYKWFILGLAALTHTFVVAMPTMSMPVLFDEMSSDLGLSLVQVGWVWGIGSLMGIFMGLVGGAVGDRFGPRQTLVVACLLVSVSIAACGLARSYTSLLATVFLWGAFTPIVPMNVHKTCGVWFSGRRLGFANSVVSVGMAFGFMLGSLLAASLLSPLLGGWRNVFFFYGAIAALFSLFWYTTREPDSSETTEIADHERLSFRAAFLHVAKLRNLWILGLASLGVAGCIQGVLGYLPLYLRGIGWPPEAADAALATFHGVSMVAAIPIALISDRLGKRKGVLLLASLTIATGVGMLSFVDGAALFVAVILAGLMRDGFMAILITSGMEVKGVGASFAGTATGFVMIFLRTGNVIAPPLGNSLAALGPSVPFVFWASLALTGFVIFTLLREGA